MNCPTCGRAAPEGARFCAHCGAALSGDAPQGAPTQRTHVDIEQNVGQMEGGEAAALKVGQVHGDLTVQATVNQVQARIVQGDYVDRRTIAPILVLQGAQGLEEVLQGLAPLLGADLGAVRNLGGQDVPANVSRQIAEVIAAQQSAAAQGVRPSPQAAYRLGLMAARNRDYEAAVGYLRQASEENTEYTDAYEALAWLQQSMAQMGQYDDEEASALLAQAWDAALHTDPLSARAMALRGYIAKSRAQLAAAHGRAADRERYAREAARLFEQAAKLDPQDPAAQNGLGNMQHLLGRLDEAIAAYRRTVALAPQYAAAWHDLALACEGKMREDPAGAAGWREEALAAWRQAYELAPDDPGFDAEAVLRIGQRIRWLERQGAT